jgi:hypothetical protein
VIPVRVALAALAQVLGILLAAVVAVVAFGPLAGGLGWVAGVLYLLGATVLADEDEA